jgi:lysophospholipase L1-like esterase
VCLSLLMFIVGISLGVSIKLNPSLASTFNQVAPFVANQKRAGLPLSQAKLNAGQPLIIGFLGGSITQNAEPDGFISALLEHLKAKFPNSQIRTLNAGMASTDSSWGSKRINRDLLCHEPDLVFIEFAVNDGNRESAKDMERIVRKIHDSKPEAEVVFIYTTSESAFRKLSKGKLPHAIAEHEKVANHYQIPSIIFGSNLYQKIKSGEWSWSNFSSDACHPTPKGYETYEKDFLAGVDRFLQIRKKSKATVFPSPLHGDFVLRSSALVALPMGQNEEMTDAKGQKSRFVESMPAFGKEWIGSANFKTSSGSGWCLESVILDQIPKESLAADMDIKWVPARWFEEGGGFTGERSRLLGEPGSSRGSKLWVAPYLSSGSVEMPQLVWTSSTTGEILLEISISKIQGHVNSPPALAGFVVILRSINGETKKIGTLQGPEGSPLQFREALAIHSGDSVLVRPFASGFEFVEFDGFEMRAGFFEMPPSS